MMSGKATNLRQACGQVMNEIYFFTFQNEIFERQHEIFNNVACVTSKGSDQPAHMRSLIRAFASRLNNL